MNHLIGVAFKIMGCFFSQSQDLQWHTHSLFHDLYLTKANELFYFTANGPFYVVFTGKKPRIYNRWHECSEQVHRFKKARFLKYKNYEETVRDFKASLGAATPLPS
jgi:hypothetical protein